MTGQLTAWTLHSSIRISLAFSHKLLTSSSDNGLQDSDKSCSMNRSKSPFERETEGVAAAGGAAGGTGETEGAGAAGDAAGEASVSAVDMI